MTSTEHQELPGGWHLLTIAGEQISIDPHGLIMFDRHITPDRIPNYIQALTKAADIANHILELSQTENNPTIPALPTTQPIITAGPPPPGSQQLPTNTAISRPRNQRKHP
jgi:hypothetical protein